MDRFMMAVIGGIIIALLGMNLFKTNYVVAKAGEFYIYKVNQRSGKTFLCGPYHTQQGKRTMKCKGVDDESPDLDPQIEELSEALDKELLDVRNR